MNPLHRGLLLILHSESTARQQHCNLTQSSLSASHAILTQAVLAGAPHQVAQHRNQAAQPSAATAVGHEALLDSLLCQKLTFTIVDLGLDT